MGSIKVTFIIMINIRTKIMLRRSQPNPHESVHKARLIGIPALVYPAEKTPLIP